MSVRWEDVNARAAGLGSRLLGAETMAGLWEAQNLQEIARAFAAVGVLPEELPRATAAELELALRRAAGNALRLARRRLGARETVVAVGLEAEDRRSLRALIRGAAAGVRAESRLAGLIPTPALPERLLQELAGRVVIRDQAALLVAAGHPYGPPILAVAAESEPDLFAIELAIARTFARRALEGASRGGRFLQDYVRRIIDGDNCRSALLVVRGGGEERAVPVFLSGGRLTPEQLQRAVAAGGPDATARAIGAALGRDELSGLVARHAQDPATLEDTIEQHLLTLLHRQARLDPLGPAPFLLYLHRLRRQSAALGRLLWSVDLGMPPAARGAAARVPG